MDKNYNMIHNKYYITTTTDLNGIITHVSQAFCEVCGYAEAELIGQPHSIIRHPDTPNEVFENLWNTIKSGEVWSGIIKNKKKNGDAYWVDSTIHPIFDKNNNITSYYSLRFEITSQYELKATNEKLEQSLEKFKKLFDNINSGIAILNKNGKFVDVNPYLCNLFDYSKEEFLNMSCLDTTNNEDLGILKDILSDIFNNKINEKSIHKQCKKNDGSIIWVETTYSYFDENHILVSITNIENLKKLEKTTSLLVTQSRDAAMGEMLSMIAHQWRQPLATLSTIISKMKIKKDMDIYSKDDFDGDFKKINSIMMHLSKTIEYFRNYFKPKTAIKENMIDIIEGLKNIIEPLCEKNNITLFFDIDLSQKIMIDNRVDQVLLNIYKNSIDACYERNNRGNISTLVKSTENQIIIEIIDDGGGIPENLIDKIFDPYFSTKNKNGTGLGLYISKDIIENNLSGKLLVENRNGGACFIIKIHKENKNG